MVLEFVVKYFYIKAYIVISKDCLFVMVCFEVMIKGISVGINIFEGCVYVEFYVFYQNWYFISYYKCYQQLEEMFEFMCGFDNYVEEMLAEVYQECIWELEELFFCSIVGVVLFLCIYCMVLVCMGEFVQGQGGIMDDVMSVYVVAFNWMNEVFQLEVFVIMEFIFDNDELIYFDFGIDFFNNVNMGGVLFGQNQDFFNGVVGLNNFDIGYIFIGGCIDVGGVVSGVVCIFGKGWGVICFFFSNVVVIVDWIVMYEVGYQFFVGYSWNNCLGILEQLFSLNVYEFGSGSIIMFYVGFCGNQNIVINNDDYYNIGFLEDFIGFFWVGIGFSCGIEIIMDNYELVIQMDYEDGFFIFIFILFRLSVLVIDEDGDNLIYVWEQFDFGLVFLIGEFFGNVFFFWIFVFLLFGYIRIFFCFNKIINNNYDVLEVFFIYSWDMIFQFVVCDNNVNYGFVVW